MPFADANGLRLYWEEYGDPEAEPLLCVMGLGADHTSFYLQRRRWSERFRVILFDNRDVGQSSPVEGIYEVPDMAADTLALADALGLDSFHLLGVSMGGAISQEVALRARERVRTLTLCVTWAGSSMWGVERARTWAANAMRASWEEHIDQLLLLTLSERMYEDTDRLSQLRDLALGNPHPQPREAFARQLDAMGR